MKEYYKNADGEDLAMLYGITGGIPLYMSMMDDRLAIEDNIKDNFLTASAYLYEEPTNLIKQECRDASQYNTIIGAIAQGGIETFRNMFQDRDRHGSCHKLPE